MYRRWIGTSFELEDVQNGSLMLEELYDDSTMTYLGG